MTAANQTAISPKGTRRPAAPTVLHLHPLGSDAYISLCGEKCTPVTPRAENTAQLCTACDAALWLQIWDLCADHHDPDHMAAEVRRIVLERAVRNSRERG